MLIVTAMHGESNGIPFPSDVPCRDELAKMHANKKEITMAHRSNLHVF